ncbi:hypothetical protein ACROYT_G018393 [Oculina patagonica]
MQVESSSTPLLSVDEVEKIQRQKIASFVGHVFQLTYAAIFDELIHEEKVNRCNGCAIQYPSQRQHSCVMMDNEDAWFYYNDEVREKIDLNMVLKTAQSVCSVLGYKLTNSWETFVTELPKFPWTSIYLTSLELDTFGEIVQAEKLQDRILYATVYGPNGIKTNDFSAIEVREDQNAEQVIDCDPFEAECVENVVRKEEKLRRYKSSALVVQSILRVNTVQITMYRNYNKFFQEGYGNIILPDDSGDDSDDESSQESEQSSQDSQSSEEIDSSQEEEEHIDPWSRIQDEVTSRHEAQLEALINEYEQHGDSPEVARVKAENALLPVYRKELRKVLLDYLQWMHAIKKDSTFRKVMETKNELKDTEGYDWLESTELAIDKRKFLLNRLFVKQTVPED